MFFSAHRATKLHPLFHEDMPWASLGSRSSMNQPCMTSIPAIIPLGWRCQH